MRTADPIAADRRAVTPTFRQCLSGLWILAWRPMLTWRRLPLLGSLLLINPLVAWLSLPVASGKAFLGWTLHLHLDLLLPLFCLVAFGGMVRDEMQEGTLGFLVTRPITRSRLFLGKFICQAGLVQGVVAVNSALLVLAGMARGIPEALRLAGWLLGVGVLGVFAFGALGAVFGLLTRRYVVLGLVYGFVVEVGVGHIPSNINVLSLMHHVHTLLAQVPAVQSQFNWSAEQPVLAVVWMVLGCLLALTAGAVLFTVREYPVGTEGNQ